MKAQASIEQLVVLATTIAFVSIAFYFAANYSSDSVRITQGQSTVDRLAAAADRVYALGPNTKEYVTVTLPDDVRVADIFSNRVLLTVGNSVGTTDIFATTKPELVGSIPSRAGKQKILVEYLMSGKVRIGEAGLACSPSLIAQSLKPGDTLPGGNSIQILNNADFEVANITGSLSDGSLVSVASLPSTALAAGANWSLGVDYNIPSNQLPGAYGATLAIGSANGGSCEVQITIHVSGETTCPSMCESTGYESGNCRPSPSDCAANEVWSGNEVGCSGSESCCCLWKDTACPVATGVLTTPSARVGMNITLNATCDDIGRGNNNITSAETQLDFGAWQSAAPASGAFGTAATQPVTQNLGPLSSGQHLAKVRCSDGLNANCPATDYAFSVVDDSGPIIINMDHSDAFPTTLAEITENATATVIDGNSNVSACSMALDNPLLLWDIAANATDGAFNSPAEDFSFFVGKLKTGMHTVYAQCRNSFGTPGGIYNDTFGVKDADVVLVIDRSGSMAWQTVNVTDDSTVTTTSNNFTLVKTLTVDGKDGSTASLSTEIKTSTTGCAIYYEARSGNGSVLASGSATSNSYVTQTQTINVSAFSTPYDILLYMRRSSSCTAYNKGFGILQGTSKMNATQTAAGAFVDISADSTQIALVSFSTSSTLNKQLTEMSSAANKTAMKNAINSIAASGSTCLECGLDTAVNELISSRGRYPGAVRVMIFMTDGSDTTGSDPIAGAVYARDNNVKIYTIGFGTDSDTTTLTNIAYLTQGIYYYAPDYSTLKYIYQHIGE